MFNGNRSMIESEHGEGPVGCPQRKDNEALGDWLRWRKCGNANIGKHVEI